MAYNNSYNGGGRGGGNRSGYGRNNSGGGRSGAASQGKKRSGAMTTTYVPKTGPNKDNTQYFTRGWRATRDGLIVVKCVTTEKSKLSDKGWFGSVSCDVVNTKTGETNFHWGTMEKKTGKVVIDKLGWVINPKARNKGYCGTYINSGN